MKNSKSLSKIAACVALSFLAGANSFAQTTGALPAPTTATTNTATSTSNSLATQQLIYNNFYQSMINNQNAIAAQEAEQEAQAAKSVQLNSIMQLFFHTCPLFNSGQAAQRTAGGKDTQKVKDLADDTDDIMWSLRDEKGYSYDSDIDQKVAESVGREIHATMGDGCMMFMNEKGQMGPWGSWALTLIKDKPESFGQNVPADITKWCPNYPKMNPSQRNLFWVWAMMSMASSEASCDQKAKNPNAPNGTAMGLFQLEYNKCPKAKNLYRAYDNITCAVDLLANELQNRDTVMTPTSKGKEGTYWGPLRSDDWNRARGGDISGAQKTRAIMKKYRYCNGSDMGTGDAQTAATSSSSDAANADTAKPTVGKDSKASPGKSKKSKLKPVPQQAI